MIFSKSYFYTMLTKSLTKIRNKKIEIINQKKTTNKLDTLYKKPCMETIVGICDIDYHLANYLDLESIITLSQINKYYNFLTNNYLPKFIKLYKEVDIVKKKYPYHSFTTNNQFYKFLYMGCWYDCNNFVKEMFNIVIKRNYLHQTFNFSHKRAINNCFALVCSRGNTELALWMTHLDIINININIVSDNDKPFRYACENGHINIAKWLYNITLKKKVNIHANNEYAFVIACINNHKELVEWLYDTTKRDLCDININFIHDIILYRCCERGHLGILKWLHKKRMLNIQLYLEKPFIISCMKNHYLLTKWLYQNGNYSKNIINKAFQISCKYSGLKLVTWLYSLGIKLKKGNHYAFRSACDYNRKDIIKFLCSKNHLYSYKINNKGKLIPEIKKN